MTRNGYLVPQCRNFIRLDDAIYLSLSTRKGVDLSTALICTLGLEHGKM